MTFDQALKENPKRITNDLRRAVILYEARLAFVRVGFAATRMELIAREAAVSTATLYALFPSKADLFSAVILDATDDFAEQMRSIRVTSGTAREQLTHFMSTYAAFIGDPFVRSVFRLVMAERPQFQDVAYQFCERGRRDFGSPLIRALTSLQEEGELNVAEPVWAAWQLMGMVEHPLFMVPLLTGDEAGAEPATGWTTDQIVADCLETFMARYGTA